MIEFNLYVRVDEQEHCLFKRYEQGTFTHQEGATLILKDTSLSVRVHERKVHTGSLRLEITFRPGPDGFHEIDPLEFYDLILKRGWLIDAEFEMISGQEKSET